jgi:chloramphenicol 3-O-phosphotransferase
MAPSAAFIFVLIEDETTLDEAANRVREVTLAALRDAGVIAPDVETSVQWPEVLDDGEELLGGVRIVLRGLAASMEAKVTATLMAAGFDPGQERPEA